MMEQDQIEALSDAELLVKLYDYAGRMSYYNAAESPQWGVEREAREKCMTVYAQLRREAIDVRHLEFDSRGFLL